jgi:hypothetical protein
MRVLTVFFITCSIFGIFQLFLDLDISSDSNEENEYRHSIVGLTVWSGRSFLCFGNFISLTAVLPMFQLLNTCCVIGDNCELLNLFQPETLFISVLG